MNVPHVYVQVLYIITISYGIKCSIPFEGQWTGLQHLSSFAHPHISTIISLIDELENDSSANLSVICQNGLQLLSNGLKNKQRWAIESE